MRVLFPVAGLGSTDMLGIMYLSAAAKSHGHLVEIADATLSQTSQKMQSFQPHVVAYSITTHDFPSLP